MVHDPGTKVPWLSVIVIVIIIFADWEGLVNQIRFVYVIQNIHN